MHRRAIDHGEDEAERVTPAGADREAFLSLPGPPRAQHCDRLGVEVDHVDARVVFGLLTTEP